MLFLLLQLTTVGAAMLADGACMQMLEYLIHDCPDPKGTMVTIEALSRSVLLLLRSALHRMECVLTVSSSYKVGYTLACCAKTQY